MDPLILALAIAIAIGLLVGLERGWREREMPDGGRAAGIRTFAIAAFLGGVITALAVKLNAPSVFVAGYVTFAVVFAAYHLRESIRDRTYSVTSVVAALAVFGLGALAVAGDHHTAAAGGAALAAILASRDVLHGLVRRLSWVELRSALVLAVMTVVVLPILPARPIDPWGGFNPQQVWLFTVLTAAISFLGYIAAKTFGTTRGALLSALAGALISSTAVTVALARAAKPAVASSPLAGAAVLAAAVSVVRVAVIVLIVAPSVLGVVGSSIIAAIVAFTASGVLLLSRHMITPNESPRPPHNPFDLGPLLIFALLFAVVSTISAMLSAVSSNGMIATSAISGVFDVDVAVLSALRLLENSTNNEAVGHAVLLALASNALGRLFAAAITGPVRFWVPLMGATIAAIALGYAALAFVPHFPLP